MYKGGCLCGKVRFEIRGDITDIIYCHCSKCRKAQGSAFATNGNLDAEKFKIISGQNVLTAYHASSTQTKYFCSCCGSPIYSENTTKSGKVRVRLGTIDSDIIERPEAHIYMGSKANWEHLNDGLPHYELGR